jgi:hypothetical protein
VVDAIKLATKPDNQALFTQLGFHRAQRSELVDVIYLDGVIEADSEADLLALPVPIGAAGGSGGAAGMGGGGAGGGGINAGGAAAGGAMATGGGVAGLPAVGGAGSGGLTAGGAPTAAGTTASAPAMGGAEDAGCSLGSARGKGASVAAVIAALMLMRRTRGARATARRTR